MRKVVSTVRELLQEEDVENIRPTLESHKINLEKQQKQIENLNQELIAELVGADAIEKEILDRCEFEAYLQETISLISSRLSFAKESKISAETTPSINQGAPIGAKTSRKAKLPKLTLPKFAGDPTEWTTFWDSFSSAIHLSEELGEVDKILVSGNYFILVMNNE